MTKPSFPEAAARRWIEDIRRHTRPGGVVVRNALLLGSSFMGLFEAGRYHLFQPAEIRGLVPRREVLAERQDCRPAPADTVRPFDTLVLRKPA